MMMLLWKCAFAAALLVEGAAVRLRDLAQRRKMELIAGKSDEGW